MTNELTTLVLLATWLLSGRGVSLCSIILFYYIGYFTLNAVTANVPALYFFSQSILDAVIIYLCCYLVISRGANKRVCMMYAVIVYTSLICDGLRLIDQGAGTAIAFDLYNIRQEYSILIDIIFAIIGSNGTNDNSVLRPSGRTSARVLPRDRTGHKAEKI